MKLKNLSNRIRNLFGKDITITEDVETHETEMEEEKEERLPFNYGMSMVDIALITQDFGWTDAVKLPKQYILVDIERYKEKVTVLGLASCWSGTGHAEWEYLLAGMLVGSLLDAWDNDETELDITSLFDRDLLASGDRVFTKEQVTEHIMPSFTKLREDDKNIYLELNVEK